jgi:hypothetical protein
LELNFLGRKNLNYIKTVLPDKFHTKKVSLDQVDCQTWKQSSVELAEPFFSVCDVFVVTI